MAVFSMFQLAFLVQYSACSVHHPEIEYDVFAAGDGNVIVMLTLLHCTTITIVCIYTGTRRCVRKGRATCVTSSTDAGSYSAVRHAGR
jgi:hypothetical protein